MLAYALIFDEVPIPLDTRDPKIVFPGPAAHDDLDFADIVMKATIPFASDAIWARKQNPLLSRYRFRFTSSPTQIPLFLQCSSPLADKLFGSWPLAYANAPNNYALYAAAKVV